MGISIKDAPLVEQLTGGEKMPLSDGSGLPKSATAEQIKEYANEGMATEQWTEGKLKGKVDNVDGKQLSTEDFTTLLKQKLDGLSNYDDTAIQASVSKLRTDLDTLVSGDTTNAIETFNEIIAFLDGLEDTGDLASIIASIERQIGEKQDKLISGTNIKTVNGQSLLGSGNIVIEGGGGSGTVDLTGYATESWVNGKLTAKVDKVEGKQLSTEDFTTALKEKLESLENYNDEEISGAIETLRSDFDTLVSGDTSSAIESFNEVVAFLAGLEDTGTLEGIVAAIQQNIAAKQDKIDDLETIREGAALGATAIQEHQDISGLLSKTEATDTYQPKGDYAEKDEIITVTDGDGTKYLADDGTYKEVDALPEGGTAGQVLTKTEEGAAWSDPSSGAGFVAQTDEPEDTSLLWVDTDDNTDETDSIIGVDAYMSDTSVNPVQNAVVKQYIDSRMVAVTEEEYEALGDSVNSDGVLYLITE